MKKKRFFLTLLATLVIIILVWKKPITDKEKTENILDTEKPLEKINLALDWTPNTNHTGIYVALNNGWYKEEGLDLQILPYSTVSPSLLISSEKADVGIGCTEGIMSGAANGSSIISIGAILAHNTSALIALASSTIQSPKNLTNKIYGGWGANYETPIINKMISNDGGIPKFKTVILEGDPIQALESKKIDFAWVFQGWEVFEAKQDGFDLKIFPLNENGIPDYYTPNFITSKENIENKKDLLKKFMKATTRGYEFAKNHPLESAEILINNVPPETFPNKQLVYDSQNYLSSQYFDNGKQWGYEEAEMWINYPQFIIDSKSIVDSNNQPIKNMDFTALYTNELLPKYGE